MWTVVQGSGKNWHVVQPNGARWYTFSLLSVALQVAAVKQVTESN